MPSYSAPVSISPFSATGGCHACCSGDTTAHLTVGAATLSAIAFAGGDATGTADLIVGAALLSAAASAGTTVYIATADLNAGAATLAASATFASGAVTATADLVAGAATLSASATFDSGDVTATANLTVGAATIGAVASSTSGIYIACLGYAVARDLTLTLDLSACREFLEAGSALPASIDLSYDDGLGYWAGMSPDGHGVAIFPPSGDCYFTTTGQYGCWCWTDTPLAPTDTPPFGATAEGDYSSFRCGITPSTPAGCGFVFPIGCGSPRFSLEVGET